MSDVYFQPDEVNVLTLETANVSVHGGRSPADGFGDRNGANDRFEVGGVSIHWYNIFYKTSREMPAAVPGARSESDNSDAL